MLSYPGGAWLLVEKNTIKPAKQLQTSAAIAMVIQEYYIVSPKVIIGCTEDNVEASSHPRGATAVLPVYFLDCIWQTFFDRQCKGNMTMHSKRCRCGCPESGLPVYRFPLLSVASIAYAGLGTVFVMLPRNLLLSNTSSKRNYSSRRR